MKKVIIFLSIIICFILFSGVISAATPEKRVTSHISDQQNPSIDGTKIVWSDNRNGPYNIYARDLASPAPEVALESSDFNQKNPDIFGNMVVWEDYRNGIAQIYYKEAFSSAPAVAVHPSLNPQTNPRIYDSKIVWQELVAGKTDIKGYDVKNNVPLTLPITPTVSEANPDINSNNVVYKVYTGSNQQIAYYNLINHLTVVIKTGTNVQHPRISGDNIVYHERQGIIVWLYKISTGTTTQVNTKSRPIGAMPDVYGNYVVWMEQDPNWNICIKNISCTTNPIISVCQNSYFQQLPCIGGNSKIGLFVAWQDDRTGHDKNGIMYRNMETISPSIVSTVPQNNQWGVNRFSSITLKFNKFINPGANYSKIRVKNLATNQYISITKYLKYDTLIIKTAAKRPRTFYQVILPPKAVISVANNNLPTTKTIKFRTHG